MFSWWQKHVYEIRTQQRYAFQIVKIRILYRRLIDKQRQTTNINNKFTINDYILQTIFDIDYYIYQTFVSIRHFLSWFFFIFNIQSFFRDVCFLKCLTNAKNENFDITNTKIHDETNFRTNYTKRSRYTKKKIINIESNIVIRIRLKKYWK